MFCPKCSQAQPAEDLRFCPRCGFPLRTVQELVLREAGRGGEARRREEGPLPGQKDIATGALLMFAGSVVAVLWGLMGTRGPAEVLLPQAYFIMGGALAFILTLFHPLLRALEGLTSGGGPEALPRRRRRERLAEFQSQWQDPAPAPKLSPPMLMSDVLHALDELLLRLDGMAERKRG